VVCLGPRVPGEMVGPRPLSDVVVRPLNFTVRRPMTHFADFSPCTYHSGPFHADSWECPLLAIGWLEHPNDFATGGRLTQDVRDRLAFFRFAFAEAYSPFSFRGLHDCSLCVAEGLDVRHAWLRDSHVNILVPGTDCVFIAPGRVDHYVEKHSYSLPDVFVHALMQCPDPRDSDYEAALLRVNGGRNLPFGERG